MYVHRHYFSRVSLCIAFLARRNYGHPVEMSLFIPPIHILRFLFAHKLRNDVVAFAVCFPRYFPCCCCCRFYLG